MTVQAPSTPKYVRRAHEFAPNPHARGDVSRGGRRAIWISAELHEALTIIAQATESTTRARADEAVRFWLNAKAEETLAEQRAPFGLDGAPAART